MDIRSEVGTVLVSGSFALENMEQDDLTCKLLHHIEIQALSWSDIHSTIDRLEYELHNDENGLLNW